MKNLFFKFNLNEASARPEQDVKLLQTQWRRPGKSPGPDEGMSRNAKSELQGTRLYKGTLKRVGRSLYERLQIPP